MSHSGYYEHLYNTYVYWPKVLTDQSGWNRFFQETWNIKKIEKNEFQPGDYSPFKTTKIYFQKKSLCYFFGQRLEGTLAKYAPSILSAIDYPVYWTFIIIFSSIGF